MPDALSHAISIWIIHLGLGQEQGVLTCASQAAAPCEVQFEDCYTDKKTGGQAGGGTAKYVKIFNGVDCDGQNLK